MKPRIQRTTLLQACKETWALVFSSRMHLDSALSRIRDSEVKDQVARVIPVLMRKPVSIAKHLGVRRGLEGVWSSKPMDWGQSVAWRQTVEALLDSMTEGSERWYCESQSEDFPPEMIEYWGSHFGVDRIPELVRSLSSSPGLTVRFRWGMDDKALAWRDTVQSETGVRFERSLLAPNSWSSDRYCRVLGSPEFIQGDFEVQDEGSQLLAHIAMSPDRFTENGYVGRQPSDLLKPYKELSALVSPLTFVDACAGAGGKTLAVADALGGRGRVFAYDVAPRKLKALSARVSRTQMRNVKTVLLEEGEEVKALSSHFQTADRVLVDAPCSGWGVLRRCPDIKWSHRHADSFGSLETLQKRLLQSYSGLVKPGGFLTYSTCTFRREETIEVVESFEKQNPSFERILSGFIGPGGPSLGGMDGFFAASFRKRKT